MSGSEPVKDKENAMLAQQAGELDLPPPATNSAAVEAQLAHVIESAREVAVVAEELLREFAAPHGERNNGREAPVPHAIVLAPRLLSATQQQLQSLLAMMRTI